MTSTLIFLGALALGRAQVQPPPEPPPPQGGGRPETARKPARHRIALGLDGLTVTWDVRLSRRWSLNLSGMFLPLVHGQPDDKENWSSYQSFGFGLDRSLTRDTLTGLSVGGRLWIGDFSFWSGDADIWWLGARALVSYTWDLNGTAFTLEGGLQAILLKLPDIADDPEDDWRFMLFPHAAFRVGWFR